MNAQFLTKPADHIFSPVPNSDDWIVRGEIRFYSAILGRVITVPLLFITDLASTPFWLWWKYPPSGKYDLAVILHDWLFWTQQCTFDEANQVLREAMLICGCKQKDANNFYWGVRLGSKGVWDGYAKQTDADRLKGFAIIEENGNIIIPEIKKAA
jgi:hypothetical protein